MKNPHHHELNYLWLYGFICFWRYPSLSPSLPPPSPSEGDLACLSVSSDDTGPISNTSCKLCIRQMLLELSSRWSARRACLVQYANNHMQITCLCVWQYIRMDTNEIRCPRRVWRFTESLQAFHQTHLKGYSKELWYESWRKMWLCSHTRIHTRTHRGQKQSSVLLCCNKRCIVDNTAAITRLAQCWKEMYCTTQAPLGLNNLGNYTNFLFYLNIAIVI